jgi:hypothetical protein
MNFVLDFFSKPTPIYLILQPDDSAKKYAGFRDGASLTLTGLPGTNVGNLLNQLNCYRTPDQQIKKLFQPDGNVIPLDFVLKQDRVGIVKEQSF